MRSRVVAVAFLFAAACTVGPMLAPAPLLEVVAVPQHEFPYADELLTGFDGRSDDPVWLAHDQVLLGLRLVRGDEVRRWLLHLEAPNGQRIRLQREDGSEQTFDLGGEREWSYDRPQPDGSRDRFTVRSKLARVVARVLDEHGRELSRNSVALPVDLLNQGLLPAIDHAHSEARGEAKAASSRAHVHAYLALRSFLDLVRHDRELADHFWALIDKPGLWSVLRHTGVKTSVDLPFELAVPTEPPAPHSAAQRAFLLPMRIHANGRPALLVDVVATDARRPYALCGGVLAAIARHPTRDDVRLELHLLAARSGD